MLDDLNQETEIPGCQLHKNDVPFWSSGTAYRVILAVLLVVFGLCFAAAVSYRYIAWYDSLPD